MTTDHPIPQVAATVADRLADPSAAARQAVAGGGRTISRAAHSALCCCIPRTPPPAGARRGQADGEAAAVQGLRRPLPGPCNLSNYYHCDIYEKVNPIPVTTIHFRWRDKRIFRWN
jgi:hypothetical protein